MPGRREAAGSTRQDQAEDQTQRPTRSLHYGRQGRTGETRGACFADGMGSKSQCQWSHVRPVWRQNGLIAYHIYRGPREPLRQNPRRAGPQRIRHDTVVTIAYLVDVVGLSFDKVCLLRSDFFQNLKLGKSQADALSISCRVIGRTNSKSSCTLLCSRLRAYRRDELESEQCACLSPRSACAVLRGSEGMPTP